MIPKKQFMEAAIAEALKSKKLGDYAVGCVLVRNDEIIARSGNRTHLDNDPTHHAEMIVIRQAAKELKSKNLSGCTIYVTHEPCPMCSAATYWARISEIVFGSTIRDMTSFRKRNGNDRWKWRTIGIGPHRILARVDAPPVIVGSFMRKECNELFHS
ncbi:MAG: nucleoside deaminase [Candidatus Berkelbacteria bacterium]|nr:nucleoside deaminase [Candidatus Berkelbacteria bacterium]MCR4307516.1 nucleoside deaminase [Candidatus Berkelbacteria bacterium]